MECEKKDLNQRNQRVGREKKRKRERKRERERERDILGTSLAVGWLRLCLPMQRVQVRSLVMEVRSHIPHSQKQTNKQKTKKPPRNNIVTDSIKTLKMVQKKKS